MIDDRVRVGLLGCGTVGAALVTLVGEQAESVAQRTGARLEITRIAVRDPGKERGAQIPKDLLTGDAAGVVGAADVDVVVELMGGIDPARKLLLGALEAGKPVVTANKELLAAHGGELLAAADRAGVEVEMEAAVAGAIPLVRPLRASLVGERIERIMGIVNGTTNYVLCRMTDDGMAYADALAEAQALGFAEANPAADVEGHDAAAKAAILAGLAFGCDVSADDVYREGITALRPVDVDFARRMGYAVKLLAVCERAAPDGAQRGGDGRARDGGPVISVRVHPAMVPLAHPLAAVRGAHNAVFVEGAASGELMFYGLGAGGRPTASAVLGDLVAAARSVLARRHATDGDGGAPVRAGLAGTHAGRPRARIRPMGELRTQYYLNIDVTDRPGVLASVAEVFGTHQVSIRSMEQDGPQGGVAHLIFLTHTAREDGVQATIEGLSHLDVVQHVGAMVRVAGGEDLP